MIENIILKCVQCGGRLQGRQRKYCSRICKNTHNNVFYQSYLAQQQRGRRRKKVLVEKLGSQCELCGYANNLAALELHHADPSTKLFQLDLRSLSNRKWEAVLAEAEKCHLLCANCHAEIHNPDFQLA